MCTGVLLVPAAEDPEGRPEQGLDANNEHAKRNKLVTSPLSWLLHQVQSPGSYPVWVPALNSFNDEQCCGSARQINLLLPKLLLSWCFITTTITLTRTLQYFIDLDFHFIYSRIFLIRLLMIINFSYLVDWSYNYSYFWINIF